MKATELYTELTKSSRSGIAPVIFEEAGRPWCKIYANMSERIPEKQEEGVPLAIYRRHQAYDPNTDRIKDCSEKTPHLDINLSDAQGMPVYRCHLCDSTFDIYGIDIFIF